MVIELAINSQADNDTGLTYGQIIESDGINAGQVIPYGPDMYRQALPIILKHGYAVASDPMERTAKYLNYREAHMHTDTDMMGALICGSLIVMTVYFFMIAMNFLLNCAGQR